MEKTVIRSSRVLFLLPLLASLVCAEFIPLSTVVALDEELTTRPYEFSDPFAQGLPTPSQGDEPLGPHGDEEKKNSIGILDRLNNNNTPNDTLWSKTTTLLSVILPDNTTSDNSSTANVTQLPVTTMQDYNSTHVTNTTVQTENSSQTVLPESVSPSTERSVIPKTQTPVMVTSSAAITLSTKSPKMPQTTSSSIPFFSSPVVNATLPPGRQRAKHPIVFLLLPFLIAGGVALLILLGSYLRKKIRLDKLRHQLMPLYSFDPAEGEDWETELLTEPRQASTQPTVTTTKASSSSSSDPPKLRFAPDTVEV